MASADDYRDYAEPSGLDELADRHCRGATALWVFVLVASAAIGWVIAIAAERGNLH